MSDTHDHADDPAWLDYLNYSAPRKRFNPNSPNAKLGANGEERALDMISAYLEPDVDEAVTIKLGSLNSRANGLLGDVLISISENDAPIIGIEVKTSSTKYPDSCCISNFEFESSKAEWLFVLNEDVTMGAWIVRMDVARKFCTPSKNGDYVVCRPPKSERVSFKKFIAALADEINEFTEDE